MNAPGTSWPNAALAIAFIVLAVSAWLLLRRWETRDRRELNEEFVDYDLLFRQHRPDYRGYCQGCLNAGHGRIPHGDCPQMRLGSYAAEVRHG